MTDKASQTDEQMRQSIVNGLRSVARTSPNHDLLDAAADLIDRIPHVLRQARAEGVEQERKRCLNIVLTKHVKKVRATKKLDLALEAIAKEINGATNDTD